METGLLREAHAYWFGALEGPLFFPKDKARIWFERADATDDYVRAAFGGHLDSVATAHWSVGALAREERVGLIVFLDQFPRNIFRDSPAAFAYDARARELADAALAHNPDGYHPLERVFLALPFEHSEALADQDRAVRLMEELVAAMLGADPFYASALDYARKHRDLIQRFHRFPHRNRVLGRRSTPEEEAFLAEHGRGY